MSLLEMLQQRHSIRKYTDEDITDRDLQTILQAGLLSASGRAARPWEFIVVRDKEMLQKMSESRVGAAKMLAHANAAIVVIADVSKTDVWVEDCSIAMSNMHLAASVLGIGSCWIHRAKETFESPEGKELLKQWGIEGNYEGIGHLILGYAKGEAPAPKPRKENYMSTM